MTDGKGRHNHETFPPFLKTSKLRLRSRRRASNFPGNMPVLQLAQPNVHWSQQAQCLCTAPGFGPAKASSVDRWLQVTFPEKSCFDSVTEPSYSTGVNIFFHISETPFYFVVDERKVLARAKHLMERKRSRELKIFLYQRLSFIVYFRNKKHRQKKSNNMK